MRVTNTEELRGLLLDTIEDVRRGKMDPKKAAAIGQLSGKILQSAKLDLEIVKLAKLNGKAASQEPLRLIGKKARARLG